MIPEKCSDVRFTKVYYGNVCNFCFSPNIINKCGECGLVSYCSTEHQKEDWSSHNSICAKFRKANEKIKYRKNCSFKEFTKYRKLLRAEIEKDTVKLSEFEAEICEFPWVCQVCYSRENLQFECDECKALVYCSLEHKKRDRYNHEENCYDLKLCRMIDSVSYSGGFKLEELQLQYWEIPKSVLFFPCSLYDVNFQITDLFNNFSNINHIINYSVYASLYASAATILFALQTIGVFHRRCLTKEPFIEIDRNEFDEVIEQMSVEVQSISNLTINSAMVIHFVAAGSYEVDMPWKFFLDLIDIWILNVGYVEIILVGPELENLDEPDFSTFTTQCGCQVYPFPYKDVVKELVEPDVVVLFNYGHDKTYTNEFDEYESQKALFEYERIPLIVTSTDEDKLENFIDDLLEIPNVQVQLNTYENHFSESRPRRKWVDKNLSFYFRNRYVAVLTRH